jgi:hypothetical protein
MGECIKRTSPAGSEGCEAHREIAYLIFASVYSLAVIAIETRRGHDIGYIILASMIFTLPYLPFLSISPPPHKVLLVGNVASAKPVVDDLDGI